MKKLLALLCLFFVWAGVAHAEGESRYAVIYSGQTKGEVVPCPG